MSLMKDSILHIFISKIYIYLYDIFKKFVHLRKNVMFENNHKRYTLKKFLRFVKVSLKLTFRLLLEFSFFADI